MGSISEKIGLDPVSQRLTYNKTVLSPNNRLLEHNIIKYRNVELTYMVTITFGYRRSVNAIQARAIASLHFLLLSIADSKTEDLENLRFMFRHNLRHSARELCGLARRSERHLHGYPGCRHRG